MLGNQDVNYSLISAVREGRPKRARELNNSFGLSYSQAWSKGYGLLCYAVKNKHATVAKLLLTSGSKVNSKNKKPSNTPLHFAAINGDIEIVKMILDKGANINAKNQYGRTALHNAIENKKMEVTELLLKHRADVNARDNDGTSPLHIAAAIGCLQIVEQLLKYGAYVNCVCTSTWKKWWCVPPPCKGANVDAQTKNGVTTLQVAVQKGYAKIVEALLKYNANVNSGVKSDITPLHLSAQRGNEEISTMLLNKGTNVNAKQTGGITALHIATQKGHKEIVKVLLECGAKVDSKIKSDITPLHLGAQEGYQEIIETILKFGANIDSRDEFGRTALHIASEEGHVEVVVTLLEYGSDINITSRSHTPLDHAKAGIRSFFNELNSYGSDGYYDGVCLCEVTAEALKRHIVKMKTANLYVSKKNLRSIRRSGEIRAFQDECEEEIASMKSEKIINPIISFYDILAKGTSSLAIYMRNENIVQVLKSDNYKTKFPIYASMIESHFRKGMERKELLEQGNKIFHFLFNNFPELPYDCTEKIFSYLSDEDLRILMDACKPLSISNPNTNINDVVITPSIHQAVRLS